MNTTKNEKQCT